MSSELREPEEMIGKTVEDVEVGYEDLVITFEDGSQFTQSLGVGNNRDI